MAEKINILLVSPLPPPAGGIATWTKMYLANDLIKNHNVELVNIAVSEERAKELNKFNVFDEIKRTLRIVKAIKTKVVTNKIDVVHFNTPCSKLGLIRDYLSIRKIKKDIPIILHCRCSLNKTLSNSISKRFFAKIAKRVTKILVLDNNSYKVAYSYAPNKVIQVSNFINDAEFNNEPVKINKILKKAMFVGHVTKLKGANLLIEAAREFNDIQFDLYGYVSSDIKEITLPENVRLLGEINKSDLIDKYNEYDLFVLPSLTEGFPNALCEAMRAGLPCISTKVGAVEEMLEDKGGKVINPSNLEELINAIGLEKDYELRKQQSIFNYNKVKDNYVIDKVIAKYLKIYEEAINKDNKDKFVIVTYNNMPNEDAGAVRQCSFAKMLDKIGYDVYILGMSKSIEYSNGYQNADYFKWISLRNNGGGILIKLSNYFGYAKKLKKELNKLDIKTTKNILVIDPPLNAWMKLKRLARKNDIQLYHDSVEWYSKEQFSKGSLSALYILKNITNTKLVDKSIKVISISSYLDNYYKSKGITSSIIPITLDDMNITKVTSNEIKFIYAGSPGKKDHLDILINSILSIEDEYINKCSFHLYGVSENQMFELHKITKEQLESKNIYCYGRVSRDQVIKAYETMNYSIFLRRANLRYAKAGFPTKFVESLMLKTPVITNISSDLEKYLIDKENGIIVRNLENDSIAKAIKQAIEKEDNHDMFDKAYESYKQNFVSELYIDVLRKLIEE